MTNEINKYGFDEYKCEERGDQNYYKAIWKCFHVWKLLLVIFL